MDINYNSRISQDAKIFIGSQNGTIYYVFESHIIRTDPRYTLVNWHKIAGGKNPKKREVLPPPPPPTET